jgi:hypothetical protein
MALSQWLGIIGVVALAAFVVFAFRQADKVKPDSDNRDDWSRFGGPPDSHGGSGH